LRYRNVKQKALMGVLMLFAGGVSSAGLAVAAGATPDGPPPAAGGIEICKTFTQAPITVNQSANFTFTISGISGTTTVAAGTCSPVIPASAGTHTITETNIAPTFTVSAIAPDPGFPALTSSNLASATAVVTVNGGVNEVRYTNSLVTGYIEVCKNATPGSGLSGTYSFGIAGPTVTNLNFATTTSAPVGGCSPAIQVPAGLNTITESGTNLYVTGISAQINNVGPTAISGSANLIKGTVTVNVVPATDSSTQTDVTYTNDVVNFKVCKTFDTTTVPAPTPNPITATTAYSFTETATGAAGPNTAPASFSLTPGLSGGTQCSNPVAYRPGTVVTVTEGITPGSKVESIALSGDGSTSPTNTTSLTGRSTSITVGLPTTSTTAPIGEAIATFTNEYANPGTLKICKFAPAAPALAPVGTIFNFTVSGVTGSTNVTLGSCAVVGGSGTPVLFPFNSTQTITETGSTGNAAFAISVVPTFVTEIVGSTPTLTTELAQAGPATGIGGAAGSSSSVGVVIGETTVTEALFTDTDPPAGAVSTPGVVVSNPGSNAGTTTAATTSIATSVASGIAATVASAPTVTITSKLTGAKLKAAIRADEKTIAKLKAEIKTAKAKHNLKRAASLNKRLRAVNKVLRALK
jgi:hypothetical protein